VHGHEPNRAEEGLKEQARLETFSTRIGNHLMDCGDFAEMLRRCTQTMVDDLGAAFARIWTLNEPHNVLELQASSGLYTNLDGRHARIPVGSLKIGLIAAERKPHLTNHVIDDPRVPEQEWVRREGMVAFAGYPLVVEDRVIGVMAMFCRSALSDSTLQAMSLVADHIALGIQRKLSEQSLRQKQERLTLALQAGRMGVYDWDMVTDALWWSPETYTVFGVSPDEFVPTPKGFEKFIHSEDRARVWQQFAEALRSGEDCAYEFRIVRPDGTIRWIANLGRNQYSTTGRPIRHYGIASDITERKQWEEALRGSENRLRAFSGQLEQLVQERTEELTQSQDRLRALATELNLAEQRERKRLAAELHDHLQQLLVLGRLKLGQSKELVETLPKCVQLIGEADGILSEALTYTRTLVAELSPPVLRDHGLAAGLKWLGEYMHKHDIAVTVTVPEADLKLPEDQALLLFQSVRELLMNAWKHARTGKADVAMEMDGNRLRLEVHDDGRGFELAAADTATSIRLSSKFGLFSIRERMKALGGSFEIDSAPNKGTTATLTLPLGAAWSRTEAEPTPLWASQDGSGTQSAMLLPSGARKRVTVSVLLVDDHAMVRQGLRTMLENYADVEVVGEACNGEEALACTERLNPAVVVMDINMPKMNGIEATAYLKARYPDITIIGLSVNAGEENQKAMKRAGATSLITKEAAVEQLYTAIQATCCQDAERPDATFSSSVPPPSDANRRKDL
jgi:PAS domain S-box-containing protein